MIKYKGETQSLKYGYFQGLQRYGNPEYAYEYAHTPCTY